MKTITTLLLFLSGISSLVHAQSYSDSIRQAVVRLGSQFLAYPQEKLYLQTDRPYYISGEKVFFRAFLIHASTNRPIDLSRYVYVELISPQDEVVIRQQIRPDTDQLFYGALSLPENLTEGNYRIRAYTRYMENLGEPWFPVRNIYIADPNAAKEAQESRPRANNAPPEVLFFPEGGSLTAGQTTRVAFKALLPGGDAASLEGVILNSKKEQVASFRTVHEGMGDCFFTPEAGEKYSAEYLHDGKTMRVHLPEVKTDAYALQIEYQEDDRVFVKVRTPLPATDEPLFLLIHRQGIPALFEQLPADLSKQFDGKQFATGVSHALLLNADFTILSERMFFNNQKDWHKPVLSANKDFYKAQESITLDIQIPGMSLDTIPASMAISVTDDRDVKLDTTTMMLTHGWRNYYVEEAMKGAIVKPTILPEKSQSLSGKLKKKNGRASDFGIIKMTAVGFNFSETLEADKDGSYRFEDFEFPDSTAYYFQSNNKERRAENVTVHPDPILYPEVTVSGKSELSRTETHPEEAIVFAEYVQKADRKYTLEHGARMIHLPEVTIKRGRRKDDERIRFDNYTGIYTRPDAFVSPQELEENPPENFFDLLYRLRGVTEVSDDGIVVRGKKVFIFVDGFQFHGSVGELMGSIIPENVAQLDLYVNGMDTLHLGIEHRTEEDKDKRYLIAITMWSPGYVTKAERKESLAHTLNQLPLGYQKPVEFYSPKYETSDALNDPTPDLRSTIYWQPDILLKNTDKTSVGFYSADAQTTYSIIIKGIGNDRRLIYYKGEAVIKMK